MSRTFLFIVLCGIFVQVYSWGAIGHHIVAQLAQSTLTKSASNWVRYLIPRHLNGNMSAMASWADTILYLNSNSTASDNWKWSRPLHYINTPDWSCNYTVERDCVNDICIDGTIRNYTKRLESSEFDDIQHQEALYFLIHFVGDIHQPLHTGFTSDRGGNSVEGYFLTNSSRTNLHSLWDTVIIKHRIETDFYSNLSLYYDHIYEIMLNQTVTSNDSDIQQWIKENLDIVCQEAYFDENNQMMHYSQKFYAGPMYYERAYPIVEQRLAQGGRRLGVLLNRLGENPPRKSMQEKLSFSISILIVVLIFNFVLHCRTGNKIFV